MIHVAVGSFRDARCAHPPGANSELTPEPEEPELPVEPEEAEEPEEPDVPVLLAPESVIEAAETVPPEPETPWTTIVSPGRMAEREADWVLVILVAEDSLTLIVFPEVSVT